MKNPELIPRVTGTFPNVEVAADSGVGLKDGSPLHKKYVQDLLGAFQAILNGASMTPDDNPETCGATPGDITGSQIVEAMQLMFCPPGFYHWFAGDTLPPGARFLKCTGTLASRTYNITGKYARLLYVWCEVSVPGSNGTAPAYYRTSDAGGTTRDAAGNYMVIPNLDGVFMRARDLTEIYDTDGSTREFGDHETIRVGPHIHDGLESGALPIEYKEYIPASNVAVAGMLIVNGGTEVHTTATGLGIDSENRPYNTIGTLCVSY